MLEVSDGKYTIQRNGSQGSSGHTQERYWVTPCLPDALQNLQFALTPCANPLAEHPEPVVLDREIRFD